LRRDRNCFRLSSSEDERDRDQRSEHGSYGHKLHCGISLLDAHEYFVAENTTVCDGVPRLHINFFHENHLEEFSFSFGELTESV
jgi:hypothetical protein